MTRVARRRTRGGKTIRERFDARIALSAALFLAGAWQIGVKGFAVEPRLAPAVAARVDPSNGAVLARFAQSQILRSVPVARDAARRALIQDPLSARATLVLALAAIDTRDIRGADRLMARAAELSRRESTADAWMFDLDMTQGRYADAFRHADVMLRREPGLGAQILPTLVRVADFPPGLPALAERLASRPPWREAFFQAFAADDKADYAAMLEALRAAGDRPTASEFGWLVERQTRLGDAPGARMLWQRATGRAVPPIVNGGFDGGASAGPLAWRGERGIGNAVVVSPRADGQGPALRIDPYAVGRPKPVMGQVLVLRPGRYVLGYEGRGEDGEGTVQVAIRCTGSGQVLASQRHDVNRDWRPATFAFAVPETGCAVQQLRISTTSNRRSDVPLWVDTFAIAAR